MTAVLAWIYRVQMCPFITTGFRENKFGMDDSFLPELISILKVNTESLNLRGLTLHIGSQLLDLTSLREAIEKTKLVLVIGSDACL